jgi:hypothetical protein
MFTKTNPRYATTELPGYVRDTSSTAIINNDVNAFETYRTMRDDKLRIKQLVEQVAILQHDVSTMKQQLAILSNKKG